MKLFEKKTRPIPTECDGMKITVQSSVCTGERTIGFYNPDTDRLMYAELVRGEEDIDGFYRKYGVKRNDNN